MAIKKIKDKAWKLFSEYIRRKYSNLDGYVECCTCGKTSHWKKLQAGHFIPGRRLPLLFEERNCHPQCYGCNICKNGAWPEYLEFMNKKYGKKVTSDLIKSRSKTVQWLEENYENLIEDLKIKIKDLNG